MSAREILLFELAGRSLAARVEGIRRIASQRDSSSRWIVESALGRPSGDGVHGLVVDGPGGERVLAVDRVLGLRAIEERALHPLPPLADELLGTRGIGGLAGVEGELLLLVDVPALVADPEESIRISSPERAEQEFP